MDAYPQLNDHAWPSGYSSFDCIKNMQVRLYHVWAGLF
jgi:hypothetical protein